MSELKNLHNSETQDTSFDHVMKYTGIFGGVQGLKMIMSVLRLKLTTIFLGSTGLGLISVYNSISDFIVSSCNFGIPLNTTRVAGELFEEGSEEEIEHFVAIVRTWIMWSAILAASICALFSPMLSYAFFSHDWHHWPQILLIIPIVVCYIIAEGECAILKGLRQVRKVAIIETLLALLTVVLTIPFYYLWGLHGIAFGLISCGVASVLLHFNYSLPLVGLRILPPSRDTFVEGLPLIQKGIPYIIAGIANSGLMMAIPAIMLLTSTMDEVGLYRAGFAIIVGYAGIAFVALEADYFPRLSSVCHNKERMNVTINQQIDVCVMFVTPILILLVLFMPWVLRVLYKPEFLVIHDMAVCAVYYTFLRANYLPIGYVTLARGDSILYLFMEVLYDIFFGILLYFAYRSFGLLGTGVALSVGALYDFTCILLVYGWKYGCKIHHRTMFRSLVQFALLTTAVTFCLQKQVELRYFFGGVAFILSVVFGFRSVAKSSAFFRRIILRVRRTEK